MEWIFFVILIASLLYIKQSQEDKYSNKHKELHNKLQQQSFNIDKEIIIQDKLTLSTISIVFDSNNRKLGFLSPFRIPPIDIIPFSNIIECEILEDSSTITKGGVGRAIVGGVIGGGVGAMVGATTRQSNDVTNSLSVRIITTNLAKPLVIIPLITSRIERNTSAYAQKFALSQEIYATIVSIIHLNNK